MADIVDDLRAADASFDTNWILFHALYGAPDVELTEFPNELAYRQYIRRIGELTRDLCGIRTLNGELVKSMQEVAIANWLFVNGIDYRYEDSYIHPTATGQRRQYHPDFYYPDIDVWHEHFALDRFGHGPDMWPGYEVEVTWKRHLHAQQGTQLIEMTSAMFRDGGLFSWLEGQLRVKGAAFNRRSRAEIDQRLREIRVSMRAGFLQTFIRHWKSNHLDTGSVRSRASTEVNRSRADAFLQIAEPVFDAYNRRLAAEGGIDFEDMVNVAADHIEARHCSSPYRVILVDEFQDISSSWARLVRALLDQRLDSRLFAVGDDWQSIYRFAGSDAQLMMDFTNRFGGATATQTATRFLTKTFRSNQGICDAAAHFIQANPAQLNKTVEAADQRRAGVIRIVLHDGEESMARALHDQLEVLASMARRDGRRVSVFVLGRYRHLEPKGLRAWRASLKDVVDVQFLTCHRAKGLETDYVFVLGCDCGDYGFPSEQEDGSLLKLVMPQSEAFPFAEERRLLYVAITRARHETWLFADKRAPSPFVSELTGPAYEGTVVVEATTAMTVEFCPRCSVGVVVPRTGNAA